jgi:hypothetical protein
VYIYSFRTSNASLRSIERLIKLVKRLMLNRHSGSSSDKDVVLVSLTAQSYREVSPQMKVLLVARDVVSSSHPNLCRMDSYSFPFPTTHMRA